MSSESAAPADSDTSLILSMVYGQSIMCTYIHTKASGGPATVKDGWKSAAALYRSCRLELYFFFFFFFPSYKYLPVYIPPFFFVK